MGIDTSIYQSLKPYEAPSMEDAQQKAMSLSQMGMQQAHAMKQMQRDDRAEAEADHQKKLLAIGGAVEHIAGLPPEQQPVAYKQMRDSLIASKAISPQDAPEEMDPQHISGLMYQLNNNPAYLQIKTAQAQLASSKFDPIDRDLARQEKRANIYKLNSEAGKLASEAKRNQPNIAGPVGDPSLLVPGQVPKEHQEAVFKEIDAAQNTKRMSKEIMDNFEKTAEENGKIGSGFGLITTHGAAGALHQALQPTFKDLEGTVRQAAMDNTFKNVTPAPGDTPATIETKRQALAQYLQSKASAPRSLAYGIDLKKYDSTSPYQVAKREAQQRGGSMQGPNLGPQSAVASDIAPNPGHSPGDLVMVGGKHYRVGSDGDTLEPIKGMK